jgi:GDP-L-fucose synthase
MPKPTVIVTGATGFIGSHVVDALKSTDKYNVVGVGSKNYDLMHENEAQWMFYDHRPQYLVNLSSVCGGISLNKDNPYTMGYKNLRIGINVLNAAVNYKNLIKYVGIGTVCSMPATPPMPIKEEYLWGGPIEPTNKLYGAAKLLLMELGEAARQQHGISLINLILSNNYGPRDNFDPYSSHCIPGMILRFENAKKNEQNSVTLYGDGSASRDFLYVEDCVEAIVKSMELDIIESPINIGSGKETSIYDLAYKIKDLTEFKGSIEWDASKPNGQPRRVLDCSKAKRLLGWEAKTSLSDGLVKTYDYYLKNIA